jgi:hypothetical protein
MEWMPVSACSAANVLSVQAQAGNESIAAARAAIRQSTSCAPRDVSAFFAAFRLNPSQVERTVVQSAITAAN